MSDSGSKQRSATKASPEGESETSCRKLRKNSNGGLERESSNKNEVAEMKRRREQRDFDQIRRCKAT